MLTDLINALRSSSGLEQKVHIQMVANALTEAHPNPYPNGDDAAIIPRENDYDLLAGEGFIDEFVAADPWFAGWCGVMVNISDISAMGGMPVAIVNAVWGGNNVDTEKVIEGMAAASKVFQVPIVGGHTNLRNSPPRLAVSIFGRAKALLSSFEAKAGQHLVAAIDLRGEYRKPYNNWDAATEAPPERLRRDLSLLPTIAEKSLASAAKDISQAGIIGTSVMLLESAQLGAEISIGDIPKPKHVEWLQWLSSFPSFGYLLTCDDENLEPLLSIFRERDISAARIGKLDNSLQCKIYNATEQAVFWDLNKTPLTSMGVSHA